jgi:hypothetical protein
VHDFNDLSGGLSESAHQYFSDHHVGAYISGGRLLRKTRDPRSQQQSARDPYHQQHTGEKKWWPNPPR